MDLMRISAFSSGDRGGNPAGVALLETMPSSQKMRVIAEDVGYSETAFLTPIDGGWRVRYFAPEREVAFCGHATIASAAALGAQFGPGTYALTLNDAVISVDAIQYVDGSWGAALQSPSTWSRSAPVQLIKRSISAFGLVEENLDSRLPLRIAHAGAQHLVIGLSDRKTLSAMRYEFDEVKAIMAEFDLTTICLIWSESPCTFHARNAFAIGGVYEDPATGAAAAAFGGYLRDIGWLTAGTIEILQGEDMGSPSHLTVEIGATPGESIRVSGKTRQITSPVHVTSAPSSASPPGD